MNRYKRPAWRATRIRCDTVERVYGSGNFDDAGDALFESLGLVSGYTGQYRCRIDIDSTHPNPWYHVMIFEIEGIPDSAYELFIEKVASLGLIDAQNSA